MVLRRLVASCVAALFIGIGAHASIAQDTEQQLQQRLLEETLRLNAQQSAPERRLLTPGDARRLDELQLRQRIEQQQLQAEHALRQRDPEHDATLRSGETQQRLMDQERRLQLQRFDLEQRDLLRSMKLPPLQGPTPGLQLQPR